MGEAVGILEVFGLVCAFMAADAGCKAGNVWLEPFDKNKPANADSLPVVVQKHIIPRPTEDTEKMLKLCAFDKS